MSEGPPGGSSLRFSKDLGVTWGTAMRVASAGPNYAASNPELIELRNGWLVMGWNNRPYKQDDTLHYQIVVRISKDKGITWGRNILMYIGGNNMGTACWEPAFLQLPSGELQIYFSNESPYPSTYDQEIAMMNSFDNGETWGHYTRVSYRQSSRDGMAVPLLLKNGKDILVSIEDNRGNQPFIPSIVKTTVQSNWSGGPVTGDSENRRPALTGPSQLMPNEWGTAPYLVQFPSGETVLSCQSTVGGRAQDRMRMQVYLGDNEGKNFLAQPVPFDVSTDGSGLWNSLGVIDDSTIVAVSSIGGYVWTVMGRLKRPQSTAITIRSRDERGRIAYPFYGPGYGNILRFLSPHSRACTLDGRGIFEK